MLEKMKSISFVLAMVIKMQSRVIQFALILMIPASSGSEASLYTSVNLGSFPTSANRTVFLGDVCYEYGTITFQEGKNYMILFESSLLKELSSYIPFC